MMDQVSGDGRQLTASLAQGNEQTNQDNPTDLAARLEGLENKQREAAAALGLGTLEAE
jgi:hypothetical protein